MTYASSADAAVDGELGTGLEHQAAAIWAELAGGGQLRQVEVCEQRVLLTSQVPLTFDQALYEFHVPIGTASGQTVGSVHATPATQGDYVWYSSNSGQFSVSGSGSVTTMSMVTGNVGEIIPFTVWAGTMSGGSATAQVNVILDPSPSGNVQFTQSTYEFDAVIGTPANTVIGSVAVTGGLSPFITGGSGNFALSSGSDMWHANLMATSVVTGQAGEHIIFQISAGDMMIHGTGATATVDIRLLPGPNSKPEFYSDDGIFPPTTSDDSYDLGACNISSSTFGVIYGMDLETDPLTYFLEQNATIYVNGDPMFDSNPFQVDPAGIVTLNPTATLIPGATYQFTAYVSDEQGIDLANPDMSRTDSTTVRIAIINNPPHVGDDGPYESRAGDVVRIPIIELLQNDWDAESSIDPASFQAQLSQELYVKRIGDELLVWPKVPPTLSAPPTTLSFTYTVADTEGLQAAGNVTVEVTPGTLKEAWMATINTVEAKHLGYRYYYAMQLQLFFTILRNNADFASYQMGSTPGANAVYSPSSNTVTVASDTTSLNWATVIHESVHIVDDFSGWYLSDSGATWYLSNAESLAYCSENLFNALPVLASFEDSVFSGGTPPAASAVISKWDLVVVFWNDLAISTYTYPYGTFPIGASGWTDFYSKFGIRGLGDVAVLHMLELQGMGVNVSLGPTNSANSLTVPTHLW